MNASPFFDARGLCLCIQSVGHRVLAVAVDGAAGQGQQRRGGLQLRCCDLQCGAVGLGEMVRVLVRKGKGWRGQRQIGGRQGKGLAFPRSAGEQQQTAARGQPQRQTDAHNLAQGSGIKAAGQNR